MLYDENNNYFDIVSNELEYEYDINKYVDKIYNELYIDNKIKINELLKLDGFITKKIVYKILSDKYGKNINKINDNHVEKILKIINSNKSNISINLPFNLSSSIANNISPSKIMAAPGSW